MPLAVVDSNFAEYIELSSCPGGYVKLKKMTWGQIQERRQMVMKMTVNGNRRNNNTSINLASEAATQFSFVNSIVEHNLEKAEGVKLNFADTSDFRMLDSRIGDEIERAIDKLNDLNSDSDEEDELKN